MICALQNAAELYINGFENMSFVWAVTEKVDFPRPEAEMFSECLNKGVPAEKIILKKIHKYQRTFFSLKHIWRKKVLISNLLSLFKTIHERQKVFLSSGLGQNL